jgi:hypothetical protein
MNAEEQYIGKDQELSPDSSTPMTENVSNEEGCALPLDSLEGADELFESHFEDSEDVVTPESEFSAVDEETKEVQKESHQAQEKSFSDSKDLNRKQLYDAFLAELEQFSDPETKLRHVIDFMASALATKQGTPYFKGFWEARTIALQLFKETVNPIVRTELWNKYAELSKEARRLKETLDEQSAFASEQIEIAIKAIETEQENIQQALESIPSSGFLNDSQALRDEADYYEATQRELQLLNAHASRITALRKELIRIEMRVRQKNKFFQRLSSAGDKTFPRRKELIKELSQRFSSDIDNFVQRYFSDEQFQESIFALREEIKTLQLIAKHLTLNTQSFTYTRMRLSECWDKLKNTDKERKRQRAQYKAIYKENVEFLQKKLAEIEQEIQAGTLNHEEAHDRLDGVFTELRNSDLGRDEIKLIRDQIGAIRQPLIDHAKKEEQERIHQIQEREKLKKFRIQELKNEINALLMDLDSNNAEQLTAKREEFVQKIAELSATKMEKQELERLLKPMRDAIVDKKEMDVLALSDDDRQAVGQLREVLQQRIERRQVIKNQLELLRKGSGSSGLDFEKALNFNMQVSAEKERLEKISEGIQEIEQEIAKRLKANKADGS